jgi:ADP-ribosyl-[dinitrogen reductase] hydrolase
MSLAAIREAFGPRGIVELHPAYGRKGAITDDTQMTLWTAEGVLRGISRGNERGIGGPTSTLPQAYMRWLFTQDGSLPSHLDNFMQSVILGGPERPSGWLIDVQGLHAQRAPGRTCLSAMRAPLRGSRKTPLNSSKGCGGVMRVAPIGITGDPDPEQCFDVACEAAALTHGHVTGWMTAGAFAFMLALIHRGMDLPDAVRRTIDRVRPEEGSEETWSALQRALDAYDSEADPTPELIESLGKGWIAEEALAIGTYAALASGGDFEDGVRLAVNHSGDSDSTGSIAGQILGLALGEEAIPSRWLEELELRDVIAAIADDLVTCWQPGEEWWNRYPGY